jgi:signal transduction histidine kinase
MLMSSLVLVVLATIAGLGWSISEFAALQNQDTATANVNSRIAALKLVGSTLAISFDSETGLSDSFIRNWNKHNTEQLSLVSSAEFGLPRSLQLQFDTGAPLLLESNEGISLHYRLPNTGKILNISTNLLTPPEVMFTLNELYTIIFYVGVVMILLLWISPLIRQLVNLSKVTEAFGMGELGQRIKVSKTSYISSIEIQFNRMADCIQELLDDNKLLSSAVSHDLKTPIARLRFGIEALEETQNEQLRVKYFQRINRDLDTMEDLVVTLLSYAHLEQANIQPDLQPIELNSWLRDIVKHCVHPERQIDFIGFTKPVVINTDPKYLSMQVNNLLSNAVRFSRSRIFLMVIVDEAGLWVHVEDDGKGIDDEEAMQVIKPFVRGQHSRGNAGHGMGLAIVNRIGQWMGSPLCIGHSTILGGARVSLHFKSFTEKSD